MDINSILIFARVVENQSFTKAALALGVEKSTVSSKIANLEKHLGVRLLNRNTRSVIPTESGELYYQHCRKILDNAVEAEEFVKTFRNEPEGLLRIAAPKGLGRILLKDLFNTFMLQYPKIDLDVLHVRRDMEPPGKRIDLALKVSRTLPEQDGMTAQRILHFYWGFFASPDYIARHGDINNIRQLEQHPTIHYVTPKTIKDPPTFKENGKVYIPRFRPHLTVNEITPCVDAIMAGLGVGFLPTGSVRDELKSGKLKQVLINYKMEPLSIWAIYPDRQWRSPKFDVFLQFIEKWGLENTEAPLTEYEDLTAQENWQ